MHVHYKIFTHGYERINLMAISKVLLKTLITVPNEIVPCGSTFMLLLSTLLYIKTRLTSASISNYLINILLRLCTRLYVWYAPLL